MVNACSACLPLFKSNVTGKILFSNTIFYKTRPFLISHNLYKVDKVLGMNFCPLINDTFLQYRVIGQVKHHQPDFFKKNVIFKPLEVLIGIGMTACWFLPSKTQFQRTIDIFSIFYFSKSTLINTQHSASGTLWGWCCSQNITWNENALVELAESLVLVILKFSIKLHAILV